MGYWRGCPVAVKIFYDFLDSDYYLRLFEQEIAVCSRARHPNIVSLCGVPLRIISELLEGSLSDVIRAALRSKWFLSLREQIDLASGITAGVTYLHQLGPDGVLHGDIRSYKRRRDVNDGGESMRFGRRSLCRGLPLRRTVEPSIFGSVA